jgi:uncharacterized protein YdhG (YjbR/CyaY superfamily)
MVQSKAATVDDYLSELPDDRREAIKKVRALVKKNLPKGYKERMSYGMITWDVPLETFPDTYNGQPLCYIGLANQKNYMSLYLVNVYGDPKREKELRDGFDKAGKKLDMGKGCVRFKKLDDLPLDVIGKVVAATPPEAIIAQHDKVHGEKKKSAAKKAAAKKK